MRPRSAVALWAAALALGGTAGLVAPPLVGGSSTSSSSTSASTAPTTPAPGLATTTPTPAPSSSSPLASPSPAPMASPSGGPPTRSDLLSVRSFADVSVEVVGEPPEKPDRTIDATSCVSDDVHATATLRKVTGHDPVLEGDWSESTTADGARQLVAVGDDEEDARESVTRLAVSMQTCEEATPGHFVLGPPTTQNYSPTRSATYVGYYSDAQNRSGRAPTGVQPCGGTLLARNGTRFTSVVVFMCLDESQLAGLAEAASERLG